MTMREVVSKLQRQGHKVEYYQRKDGGILVKSVDGVKFPSGASGNAYARDLAGVKVSETRTTQLSYAMRQRGKRQVKIEVPDNLKTYYKDVKKKWAKVFKSKDGKAHQAGYMGYNKLKKILKEQGEDEAFSWIAEKEKYASGIAYYENVRILSEFIRGAAISGKKKIQELIDIADYLIDNAYSIKEEWISKAYEIMYKMDKNTPPEEVARQLKLLFGII